jgi:hypothetical protein
MDVLLRVADACRFITEDSTVSCDEAAPVLIPRVGVSHWNPPIY